MKMSAGVEWAVHCCVVLSRAAGTGPAARLAEFRAKWSAIRARYFGTELGERTLVPGDDARLAETRFDDWLSQAGVSTP
jgi:hypothetical protein